MVYGKLKKRKKRKAYTTRRKNLGELDLYGEHDLKV